MQVSCQKFQVEILCHTFIHFNHWKCSHLYSRYGFFPSYAVGYSSNNSSLTDLSHRRSGSGGSASTGIGSILEHSDQQVERGEKENKTTPPVSATNHHTFDSPAIHLKAQRWYRQLLWPWNSMLLIRWWSFDHYYILSMLYLTWWQCIVFPNL